MSDTDWMPGTRRVAGAASGGTLIGGPARCTWHITWDRLDPRPSFDDVAAYLARMNYDPTLLWNPEDGDVIQFLPASRSAYALVNLAGGAETNRDGDVHVQIEVYFSPGYKNRALFTDGPLVGLEAIMAWLDTLGVPRVAAGDFAHPTRDINAWLNNAGHFGHMHVPENAHTDPIAGTDIARILAAGLPQPSPQHAPWEDDMPTLVVRRVVANPTNPGQGYILDSRGAAHPFGGAKPLDTGTYFNNGAAIDLIITDWTKLQGYVLDALGALHPFGGLGKPTDGPYWPGAFVPPLAST